MNGSKKSSNSIGFALLIGLFDIGIVRRLNRLTENVSAISKGKEFQHPLAKKDDAIGLLEQEIVKIGEKNNLETKSEE